ncbi:hypothetical protein IQ273_30100 [Nodosilinea sp. LEGE 07298]|uniref:hypothetical protein n=1 Tax=Nodosilinea sp. LEGE 07298 TaxID=2777970 RepID=UPI001882A2F1|nr:hypothetical protein [Nodosilinea sp. LEGE 07298]MBE9113630.1 hypothetical protein [Nodosilinea sp. LEGE 07298]
MTRLKWNHALAVSLSWRAVVIPEVAFSHQQERKVAERQERSLIDVIAKQTRDEISFSQTVILGGWPGY